MELNRNHYMTIGLVVMFLGIQLRAVKSFTLTEHSTRFVVDQLHLAESPAPQPVMAVWGMTGQPTPEARRQVEPPRWLGFSLISIGAVLVLQSFAMKKPGG
jgi:uncharacterized membrane protein